jgi:hypothetical protein
VGEEISGVGGGLSGSRVWGGASCPRTKVASLEGAAVSVPRVVVMVLEVVSIATRLSLKSRCVPGGVGEMRTGRKGGWSGIHSAAAGLILVIVEAREFGGNPDSSGKFGDNSSGWSDCCDCCDDSGDFSDDLGDESACGCGNAARDDGVWISTSEVGRKVGTGGGSEAETR